jgi:hypothetical protein
MAPNYRPGVRRIPAPRAQFPGGRHVAAVWVEE